MRRGRWIYHPDQYVDQSPVFQVKNIAVRLTAYVVGGHTPQIQILVGDDPSDPTAYWVDWRQNGQEVQLGNDSATQLVVATAGWYRVDVDDIQGTNSLIWVEDEEGTMDDRIVPAHFIRAGCGGGAGAQQPPITDPIMVTCSDLHNLVASGAIVPSQWYGITDVVPSVRPDQIVYVQGIAPDRVETSGFFWAASLTGDGYLWPCKLYTNAIRPCILFELYDVERNNLMSGVNSVQTWDWGASNKTNNRAYNTTFTLLGDFQIDGCVIRDSHVLCYGAGSLLYSTIVRSEVSLTGKRCLNERLDISDSYYHNGGHLVSNCYVHGNSEFRAPLFISFVAMPPIRVDSVHVSANSELMVTADRSFFRYSPEVSGITVQSNGQFEIDGFYHPDGYPFVGNVTVDNSVVQLMRAGFVSGLTATSGSFVRLNYGQAIISGLRSPAHSVNNLAVSGRGYVNLSWANPSTSLEPRIYSIQSVSVAGNGVLQLRYPEAFDYNITNTAITGHGHIDTDIWSGSSLVQTISSSFSSFGHVRGVGKGQNTFTVRYSTADSGGAFVFQDCDGAFVDRSTASRGGQVELRTSDAITLNGFSADAGRIIGYSLKEFTSYSQFRSADGSSITFSTQNDPVSVDAYGISAVESSRLYLTFTGPRATVARGIEVTGGAAMQIGLNAQLGPARMHYSSFVAGASGTIGVTANLPFGVTVRGLFAYGTSSSVSYIFTSSYNGIMGKNY